VSASARQTYAAELPSDTGIARSLAQAFEEAVATGGTTLVALPAPVAPAEVLIAGKTGDAVAWQAPGDFELAALGTADVITGHGQQRFQSVEAAGSALLGRVRSFGVLGAAPAAARLFGGFSFRASEPRLDFWRPLGEARFVLPELSYVSEGGQARLVIAVTPHNAEHRSNREQLVEAALAALSTMRRPWEPPSSARQAAVARHEGSAEAWSEQVEAIRAEIGRGHLEKVVLARRVSLELAAEPDAGVVLGRLLQEAPQCTRFLFRHAGVSFLGATPELLARKQGADFETAAVAGSMSAQDREGAVRLLESLKDHAEHAFVVREIVRALSPFVRDLEHTAEPELYELRHVLHLRTRVRATLSGSAHLLDLVERLHPTPAVGGVPTARALEWLFAHEPDERGWYAGPIGWFDANGDGEMAVALRSGVLHGRTAHLYSGSGIVERSTPAAELIETRWKLASLLAALGVAD
jgi:isochorismate synthase